MRAIAVAVHKLIFRDGRLDFPTIYVVVAMAIVLVADIAAYLLGPSVYGGNSVSNFGPNWTAWLPFGAFLVFAPVLVFCETRKHLIPDDRRIRCVGYACGSQYRFLHDAFLG